MPDGTVKIEDAVIMRSKLCPLMSTEDKIVLCYMDACGWWIITKDPETDNDLWANCAIPLVAAELMEQIMEK